tara:strand:+ start:246 stop:533 length:288 start_codon:yes stop_codon:yes gene_type:complete
MPLSTRKHLSEIVTIKRTGIVATSEPEDATVFTSLIVAHAAADEARHKHEYRVRERLDTQVDKVSGGYVAILARTFDENDEPVGECWYAAIKVHN